MDPRSNPDSHLDLTPPNATIHTVTTSTILPISTGSDLTSGLSGGSPIPERPTAIELVHDHENAEPENHVNGGEPQNGHDNLLDPSDSLPLSTTTESLNSTDSQPNGHRERLRHPAGHEHEMNGYCHPDDVRNAESRAHTS